VVLPHSAAFVAERDAGALQGVEPVSLARLAARAGVTRLSELGVTEDRLDDVVEAVLRQTAIGNTPGGTPTAAEVRGLLGQAL
jgi:alcohol dehydrogenase class IV